MPRHPRGARRLAVKPKIPLIPGHEGVGSIETLGDGVDTLAVDDRVALPWLGRRLRTLSLLRRRLGDLLHQPAVHGVHDGRLVRRVRHRQRLPVVRVPDGVSSFDAAPLTCAGVTTYKALKVAHPQPGALLHSAAPRGATANLAATVA